MAAVKASRRAVPAEFAKSSSSAVNNTAERKGPLKEDNGATVLVDGDKVSHEEEIPQPIGTGDLRLNLTRKSPSLAYLNHIRMERLLDKLMLLNYTVALPHGMGNSGLPKNYFFDERPDQAVGRFHVFASLAVWMIGQLDKDMKRPTERDDPSMTVQNISEALQTLGVQVETSPHRLKNAQGSDVVAVLYELASLCLKKRGEVITPDFSVIASRNGLDEDDDGDAQVEEEEYDVIPLSNWEQEEVADDLNDNDVAVDNRQSATEELAKQRAADDWRLEADRMGPLFNRPDGGGLAEHMGWSDRVKKLEICRKELNQSVDAVAEKLGGISAEISRSTEKIANREKYLTANHRDKVERYRGASSKYHTAKARYETHNAEVELNARKLAELTQDFEKLKRRVEEQASSSGDKAALTGMKSAMKRMKDDIGIYSIKCAIAEMRLQELTDLIQSAEVDDKFSDSDAFV